MAQTVEARRLNKAFKKTRTCNRGIAASRHAGASPKRIIRDTPRPYTRSRPPCNLSDQILELGIESRRGLKQRRIFAGHHQRRWQVIDDRHALAILVLYQKQLDGREQCSLKVVSYHGNCDDRIAKNPPRKLPLNTI